MRQMVGRFELPDTEPAADPIAGPYEQHCLLLFAHLAHGNGRHRSGFPASILKVEASARVTRNSQQEEIGQGRLCDILAKQDAVSAERKDEVRAFEGPADCAVRKLRIEVSDTIEPKQAGHNPVPPHLASAQHTCGIEVGGVPGVAVTILGIAAETRPPITAE